MPRRGFDVVARPAVGEQVPDAVAPPPGNPRFPLFDSVRALAALSIVAVHAGIFSDVSNARYWPLIAHLDIGVPIFFLLSGFLLYRPMLSARVLGTPSTPYAVYSLHRFLRIMPAYWLALTVLAIVPGLCGVFSRNWWVYYGLLQNYPVYSLTADCVANPSTSGIAPTWSLALEVAFYVVLPFFARAMDWLTSRFHKARWLVLELTTLAILSAISVVIQARGISNDRQIWLFFSPLGRAWWFAIGMGLAAVSVWADQRGSLPRAVRLVSDWAGISWVAAMLLYVLSALFVLERRPSLGFPLGVSRFQYLTEYLLTGVIGVLILLPAVFWDGRSALPQRFLAHPALAWLGLVSYGIFLWHYPIILGLIDSGARTWWPGMTFPILLTGTLAITLVCATLSYYLLERPLMRFKRRRVGVDIAP